MLWESQESSLGLRIPGAALGNPGNITRPSESLGQRWETDLRKIRANSQVWLGETSPHFSLYLNFSLKQEKDCGGRSRLAGEVFGMQGWATTPSFPHTSPQLWLCLPAQSSISHDITQSCCLTSGHRAWLGCARHLPGLCQLPN